MAYAGENARARPGSAGGLARLDSDPKSLHRAKTEHPAKRTGEVMKLYDKLFINGDWVSPAGKGSIEVINAGTEEVPASVRFLRCFANQRRLPPPP